MRVSKSQSIDVWMPLRRYENFSLSWNQKPSRADLLLQFAAQRTPFLARFGVVLEMERADVPDVRLGALAGPGVGTRESPRRARVVRVRGEDLLEEHARLVVAARPGEDLGALDREIRRR